MKPHSLNLTIMQVLPSLSSGGVERGTIDVANHIAQIGWKSIVVSSGGKMVSMLKKGVIHDYLPINKKNPISVIYNAFCLASMIRKYNVSIVHVRSRAPAWSVRLAAKMTKVRVVTTFHGVYGHSNWFKRLYNSAMLKSDHTIAVSNFVYDHIFTNYSKITGRNKVSVIHRGIDTKLFNYARASRSLAKKILDSYNIPDDKKIILFPGRIESNWKGHSFLIKALADIVTHTSAHEKEEDFICLFVGKGSKADRNNLLRQITKYNLNKYILILDDISKELIDLYASSDAVIVPSIKPEAFGRVIAEAGAMGKPVITTNIGGAKEIVIPGITGWLVEPNNTKQLATTIQSVLNLSPDQRTELSKKAIEHINENFSLELMLKKTIDVYKKVCLVS